MTHDLTYDFDRIIDRRTSDSVKWRYYGPDVLPLWVADMDFVSPQPVIQALQERVAQSVFGYGVEPDELRAVLVERLASRYGWHVAPEAILFVPGVVNGFNHVLRSVTTPGQGVLVQTPVYPPMLSAPASNGLVRQEMELTGDANGYYSVDLDAFEAALTPSSRVFLLCNPHNPAGRTFTPAELSAMAEICLRHDMLICSDEIHCDLVFPGYRHTPIATLAPEIARRTLTLLAPSKTYNIAGLATSVLIVEDVELRRQATATLHETSGGVNILGFTAALAAYRDGEPWLEELLAYLTANRDFLVEYVHEYLPGISMGIPEATYLAWLDCRQAGLPQEPFKFFLNEARVALNDGRAFGKGGAGYARLNFGCPRATLEQALERMRAALARLAAASPTNGRQAQL